MRMLMTAAALVAVIGLPAVAASAATQGKTHATKHHATNHMAKHGRTVRTVNHARAYARPQPFSSHVHYPSYDVYVKGEYVGSDPDPRIRETLRREYCLDSLPGAC